MNDIPNIAPDTFASATAGQLIDLLVTHEDRVPRTLFDACVARGDAMVAALAEYFQRCDGADVDDESCNWWMEVHGFWLAGAIPGEAGGRLLIDRLRQADRRDDSTLDWVAGHMAWLFANKPAGIAIQARALAADREVGWFARCEAVDAMIGMAHADSPATLEDALEWLAALISQPDEDKDVRRLSANLLLDFPRPRFRTMLDLLAAEQESESRFGLVFDSDDVARAFLRNSDAPNWIRRGPPWTFYDDAQIVARQDRWREEIAAINRLYPETYQRDTPKLGRNDPCRCGSGKKYKKCCLPTDEAGEATRHGLH